MLTDEEVLWVVQIGVQAILDGVNDSRFQINQKCAGYIMLIVSLIEEDIFSIVSLGGILLKNTLSTDAVLHAELLPELVTDYGSKNIRNRWG